MPDVHRFTPCVGRVDVPGRHGPSFPALLIAALLGFAAPARAAHDPARTVTVYVHGFDDSGADRHGVYGADIHEALEDTIAALVGLPVADTSGGPLAPDAVTATTYYGDTAPGYYTPADRDSIDRLTAAWGGGVPRYAYIVARFAQHALERSGAQQVNFVSASFGALIVRWVIENNMAGLAGSGCIARWLSVEGLIAGNWAASRGSILDLAELIQPQPIDVDHMTYDWVSTNVHTPRTQADNPLYAGILIGQMASTGGNASGLTLSNLMLAAGDYMPNDGVQALPDALFQDISARSELLGLPPTRALVHTDHLGIRRARGAFADAATFITARRRITVTMTSARVNDLHEPQFPWLDLTPAEVVFESRVYSPAVWSRWGIGDPLSVHLKEDTTAPLRRFHVTGETQTLADVVFDDFVLPEENRLHVDLHAWEVDADPYYGVYETTTVPDYDDMGGGSVDISTVQPGSYTFAVHDWSCQLAVQVVDYPFPAAAGVPMTPRPAPGASLLVTPNPASSAVRILLSGAPESAGTRGVLRVSDVAGRVVRVLDGALRSGFEWDGRDARGHPVPPGVYVYRLVTDAGVWMARSCRVR